MTDTPKYFDRQGNPITFEQWPLKFEDEKYRTVARTSIAGVSIETIWLGLNHRTGPGKPLIFETAVFPANGGPSLHCQRYETEAQAIAGHAFNVLRFTGTVESQS